MARAARQAWADLERGLGGEKIKYDNILSLYYILCNKTVLCAARQAWADLERGLGRRDAARRLYARAAEANPRLPSVYHAWAGLERVRALIYNIK